MFGIGPTELLVLLVLMFLVVVPCIMAAVVLWMAFSGKFQGPKSCPKCGAILRR